MARYAIDNRIERAVDLEGADSDGYRFAAGLPPTSEFTFVRLSRLPVAQVRTKAQTS